MMSCTCSCDYGGDAEPCDFISYKFPKARKQYKCYECGEPILSGEQYSLCSAKWNGEIHVMRRCIYCHYIQDSMICFVFGSLRDVLSNCNYKSLPWIIKGIWHMWARNKIERERR